MKTSDTNNQAADKATRHSGVGHTTSFLCARCVKPKSTAGRRLRRVLGLRTYVCAGCAE